MPANINKQSFLSKNRCKYKYLTYRPSKANAGYTLLELIIVVGIMGILFSIGVSNFSDYNDRMKLTNSSQKMAREINWGKNYGIVREQFCAVQVWSSENLYQIFLVDSEGSVSVIAPPGEILTDENKTELDSEVQLNVSNCAKRDPCIFTYNYLADVWDNIGKAVEITFSLTGQTNQTVDIDNVTGVAYVQ